MVSTTLGLDGLPMDILLQVLDLLGLKDLSNFCLVSRTLAATCRHSSSFQRYFATKTLKWNATQQMQQFVHLTHDNHMGCLLRNLRFVGVIGIPVPLPTELQSLTRLLAQAFTNLRLNSPHASLQSITLLVQVQVEEGNGELVSTERYHDWEQTWRIAAQTFQIVSRGLAQSALHIEKLDSFGSINQCSLACNEIGQVLDTLQVSSALGKLTSLSLSLSHHARQQKLRSGVLLTAAQRYTNDIARLLGLCQQVQSLELHWYSRRSYGLDEADEEETRFFAKAVQSTHFSQLRTCRLAGIYTDETTLLTFLQKNSSQLTCFSMDWIHLKPGRFGPILDYLTNDGKHLDELLLDSLWEKRLIFFDGPGKPSLPTSNRSDGPNFLTRKGVDCHRKIRYGYGKGVVLGSAQANNWLRGKYVRYGPPEVGWITT